MMSETFRHCPECDEEQLFEQYHPVPGGCPDTPDGICSEWACTGCGTALLAGFLLCRPEPAWQADAHSRVA